MSEMPKPRQSPEMDSDADFELALSLAWTRLREAETILSVGYAHVRNDRHPDTIHLMDTCLLAESYEELVQGKGDPFTVSMPIDRDNPDRFLAGQDQEFEYFVVGKPGDYDSQVTVRRQDFATTFQGEQPAPVDNLIYKLTTYEVVPYLKYA